MEQLLTVGHFFFDLVCAIIVSILSYKLGCKVTILRVGQRKIE